MGRLRVYFKLLFCKALRHQGAKEKRNARHFKNPLKDKAAFRGSAAFLIEHLRIFCYNIKIIRLSRAKGRGVDLEGKNAGSSQRVRSRKKGIKDLAKELGVGEMIVRLLLNRNYSQKRKCKNSSGGMRRSCPTLF
jgi:hypothetical protein